jgi:transcriptional regulator with XRE-family HTH domain
MSPGGRPRQRPKTPSQLGAAITRARGERSQREMAAHAGLSVSYLSALEAGEKASPGLPVLRRLAEALGVPIGELVGSAGLRVARLEHAKLQRARDRLVRQQDRFLRAMGSALDPALERRVREMFGAAIAVLNELLERPERLERPGKEASAKRRR